jgi:quercetin dioxygenase-like cupin family protein
MHYQNLATVLADTEDLPWHPFVPCAANVSTKLLKVDPVRGQWVSLIKAPGDIAMPKHQHSGAVLIYTLAGSWRCLEHDWVAAPGSFIFEPPGVEHTPFGLDAGEIITVNVVHGGWSALGRNGAPATENWETAVKRYLDHCSRTGIAPVDIIRID